MINPFSISSKTFVITGASSGIGRHIAIVASKMGANLILKGRNKGNLQATLSMLDFQKKNHLIKVADLTNDNELADLVSGCPQVDGIVHAAGVLSVSPFKRIKKHDIERLMHINYVAPVLLTNLLLKKKKVKKGGSIVFISSINGVEIGTPGFVNYAGSKGAVTGIVKSLAAELAPKYRVNAVTPGMIKTPMSDYLERISSSESILDDKMKYLMKDYGEPEDVAYAVVYLLSEASKWVTGTSIIIDGGVTAK